MLGQPWPIAALDPGPIWSLPPVGVCALISSPGELRRTALAALVSGQGRCKLAGHYRLWCRQKERTRHIRTPAAFKSSGFCDVGRGQQAEGQRTGRRKASARTLSHKDAPIGMSLRSGRYS